MRWLLVLTAAGACSDTADAPPEPAKPPRPPPPPCTRTLKLGKVRQPPGYNTRTHAAALAMLDERTLAALYYERDFAQRADGLPRGPEDRLGVALYDLRHTYAHGYNTPDVGVGGALAEGPLGSFPVQATRMVVRAHSRTLLLAGLDGFASLDVTTGCLRALAAKPAHDPEQTGPFPFVAFDRVHGRFFAIADKRLLRVDDDLTIGRAVPIDDDLRALAYDDAADRVIAKTRDGVLLTFAGATLARGPRVPVKWSNGGTSADDGPWVRPGHREAFVTYAIRPPPCPEDVRHRPDEDLGMRRGCANPPGTGNRLALIDLDTGRELRVADIHQTEIRPYAVWSDNGDVFLIERQLVWRLAEPQPEPIDGVHGYSTILDAAGATWLTIDDVFIIVGDLATRRDRWSVIAPPEHAAEQPR